MSQSINTQIAGLLNSFNDLNKTYYEKDIVNSDVSYHYFAIKDSVIGVVGVRKLNHYLTELKHLCVHPQFRNKGIAKKLILLGLNHCSTPVILSTIRQDNTNSIKAFISSGFEEIDSYLTSEGQSIKILRFKKALSKK